MTKFGLQPVLKHRRFLEDEQQKKLADAQRAFTDARCKLHAYASRRQELTTELEEKQLQGLSITESLLYVQFFDRLAEDMFQQDTRVQALQKRVDHYRDALVKAMQSRKSLERLKEKNSHRHRLEQERKAQAFFDEVAEGQFIRHRQQQELSGE